MAQVDERMNVGKRLEGTKDGAVVVLQTCSYYGAERGGFVMRPNHQFQYSLSLLSESIPDLFFCFM